MISKLCIIIIYVLNDSLTSLTHSTNVSIMTDARISSDLIRARSVIHTWITSTFVNIYSVKFIAAKTQMFHKEVNNTTDLFPPLKLGRQLDFL